jgi:hypothetical protein
LLYALCSLSQHIAYFTFPPQAPKGDVKIGIISY